MSEQIRSERISSEQKLREAIQLMRNGLPGYAHDERPSEIICADIVEAAIAASKPQQADRESLLKVLTAYEGAVQEATDTPDDDGAVEKLRIARENLMDVLQAAKIALAQPASAKEQP